MTAAIRVSWNRFGGVDGPRSNTGSRYEAA